MRSPKSILTTLTIIPFTTSLPILPTAAICPSYTIINVRGTGEVPNTFFATGPMIQTILTSIPGGVVHETIYPAASGDISQDTTQQGVDDITKVIQTGLKSCPHQKYVITAYSQGATVADRVLRTFSPDSPEGSALTGIVALGNPYHIPGQPSNIDQDGGKSTVDAVGALVPTRLDFRMPKTWYDSGKVLDICYMNDSICDNTNVQGLDLLGAHLNALDVAELLMSGQLHLKDIVDSAHLAYPASKNVQTKGAEFLIERL